MNDQAVAILQEFVADIEAVGVDEVEQEWPDLVPTYRKARRLLDTLGASGTADGS